MSKKPLDTAAISQDLESAVSLFAKRPPSSAKRPVRAAPARKPASNPPSNHDTMQPSLPDEQHAEMLEAVRAAVKTLGKEAATYRFTLAEKKALADVVYTYKRSGTRTSENELTRIAVNWLLDEYRRNGQTSVLASVLERLNA